MTQFYQAGSFLDDSPITDVDLACNVPEFYCPACGASGITTFYNYPHLNPADTLSSTEIRKLGPVIRSKGSNEEILQIVRRLRRQWNMPITAGTIFGPTRIKVGRKPKVDFCVLICHAGLFCRREAAEKLLRAGVAFNYVRSPAVGKYAPEADYVEFIVPVGGHCLLPRGKAFCDECLRYSPGGSFETFLIREGLPAGLPFFKLLEKSVIIFSSAFIALVNHLGLSGFVEGKTLLPVAVEGR